MPHASHRLNGALPLFSALHPIHSPGIFDPSGGLQTADGQWHTFEDSGGWFHYVSPDLIDWRPAPQMSTGFHIHGGMTGAVSRLKGGGFAAFLPNTNQTGMWRSFSHDLDSWQWPPTTPIKVPPHALPHNFHFLLEKIEPMVFSALDVIITMMKNKVALPAATFW